MIRIIDDKKSALSSIALTRRETKNMVQAILKILGIVVAEEPTIVQQLLSDFGVQLSAQPTSKELLDGLMDMIALQDPYFNDELTQLIEKVIPEFDNSAFDNFTAQPSSNSSGGGGMVEGAAAGASSGGIWGAAIGALGGLFNETASRNQQKIEKDKASAQSFQALMTFKSVKEQTKAVTKSSTTKIILFTIGAIVGLGCLYLFMKNRRNNHATAA